MMELPVRVHVCLRWGRNHPLEAAMWSAVLRVGDIGARRCPCCAVRGCTPVRRGGCTVGVRLWRVSRLAGSSLRLSDLVTLMKRTGVWVRLRTGPGWRR